MKQKGVLLIAICVTLLLADLAYSFYQHMQQPIHGDLVAIVLPEPHYAKVLEEPFGFAAIIDGERYAGSNRFMIHRSLKAWFDHVPHFLQHFTDPVTSLYAASAIFKTLLQLFLCLILAAYMRGAFAWRDWRFWLIALCVAPFIQVFGFRSQMGIIDPSIVYTFFYAFPLSLLLLFFFPFYTGHTLPRWQRIAWVLLATFLAFSGPLIGPLAVLTCGALLILDLFFFSEGKYNRLLLGYLLAASLYSVYLGSFNVENGAGPAVLERYALMPQGLARMILNKLAWPAIIIASVVSLILYRKKGLHITYPQRWNAILIMFAILGAYLLLLPLGGYRPYRPYIIRYDTFMPGTFIILIALGSTAFRIISQQAKSWYSLIIIALLFIFWNADRPKPANACEKAYLTQIGKEPQKPFPDDCAVLSWKPVKSPQEAESIRAMLERWGIVH